MLCFFFFNDTATTEIYTLSLHDALPICRRAGAGSGAARAGDGGGAARGHAPVGGRDRCESGGGMVAPGPRGAARGGLLPRRGGTARERRAVRVRGRPRLDRKSTRLNSSHSQISYAVFCLKKKKD